jgi:chromosomal replication initiation ATPase DnaA
VENLTPRKMKAEIFNQYATKVAAIFNIPEEELFMKSKKRGHVDARHLLYYACSKRPMRVVYIQNYMKERGYDIGHTSILHGIQKATHRIQEDRDYKRILKKIVS